MPLLPAEPFDAQKNKKTKDKRTKLKKLEKNNRKEENPEKFLSQSLKNL